MTDVANSPGGKGGDIMGGGPGTMYAHTDSTAINPAAPDTKVAAQTISSCKRSCLHRRGLTNQRATWPAFPATLFFGCKLAPQAAAAVWMANGPLRDDNVPGAGLHYTANWMWSPRGSMVFNGSLESLRARTLES